MTTSGTLYVPAESVELYKEAFGWKDAFQIKAIGSSGIDDVTSDHSSDRVDVYDLQGRIVMQKATDAELRTLKAGIYIVTDGTATRKMIVK